LGAVYGRVSPLAVVGLVLAAGLLVSTALHAWRHRRGGAMVWGMSLAHAGVAVFAVGVSMVNTYGVERDVQLAPGDTTALAECSLRFDGVTPVKGTNYDSLQASFDLSCPGAAPLKLMPEKRSYPGSAMPMTESAIVWGVTRDLYVAMADMVGTGPSGPWMVRLQVKPFMRWVWGGAVLMALGGLVASLARRYRLKVQHG
jgi:cytochrome c-type biogenesis protein CcmF